MGSSSTSSLLACLIQFGLLSRGLWKFVWSISHVSPAVSRVCPLESDPNRTTDHHHSPLCFSSPAMWLDLSLSILMAPSYPLISTCCVQYFPHIICSTCFLSGWSVGHPSVECILHSVADGRTGTGMAMYPRRATERWRREHVRSSCKLQRCSGVDGRVLSHCLHTLAHQNVQYHLSDLDHQFAVIIISIDTVGGGDEQKEFLSSTKDSFLAIEISWHHSY